MDEAKWFYAHRQENRGPVSFDDLKSLAAEGGLGPGTLVWQQGTPEWVRAGEVAGLFAPEQLPPPRPDQRRGRGEFITPGGHFRSVFGFGSVPVLIGTLVMFIGAVSVWSRINLLGPGLRSERTGVEYWQGIIVLVLSLLVFVALVVHHFLPHIRRALLGLSIGYTAAGFLAFVFALIAMLQIDSAFRREGVVAALVGGLLVAVGGFLLMLKYLPPVRAR